MSETSSVTQRVYLSLGSNLGDREQNLRAAVAALQQQLEVEAVSSWYETEPVGIIHQPGFLNLALAATTRLDPPELLKLVKRIEEQIGRRPTYRWGPRLIDIDILLYADRVVEGPDLAIPHRELAHRAFVLFPLAEVGPQALHPVLHKTVRQLVDAAGPSGVRRMRPFEESPYTELHQ
ncbi:MAG: 2-amino-4-hydroxy-6-hydroxymethyldihydropteridine diphosphokinase [Chloroflexota bacterium]|nr:2-amino-4-hydroxy-6-hydroxymethyldihydropteridine diphosphokinase [Chloroflexota bacterium]